MPVYNLENSNALLLYKVGPVLVCSPTLPVESVVLPPHLTSMPGVNEAEPGMFKSIYGMVRVVDLRVRFGVDSADRKSPGQIVIAEVAGGHAGFWVDQIEDVISFPEKGWSKLPSHVPNEVFGRALLQGDDIRLYADFENLDKFKSTGYLRRHIEFLKKKANPEKISPSETIVSSANAVAAEKNIHQSMSAASLQSVGKSSGSGEILNKPVAGEVQPPAIDVVTATKSKVDTTKSGRYASSAYANKHLHKKIENPVSSPVVKQQTGDKVTGYRSSQLARASQTDKQSVASSAPEKNYESGARTQASKYDNTLRTSSVTDRQDKNVIDRPDASGSFSWWLLLMLVLVLALMFYVIQQVILSPDIESSDSRRVVLSHAVNENTAEKMTESKISHEPIDGSHVEINADNDGVTIVINDYEESVVGESQQVKSDADLEEPDQVVSNDVVNNISKHQVDGVELSEKADTVNESKPESSIVKQTNDETNVAPELNQRKHNELPEKAEKDESISQAEKFEAAALEEESEPVRTLRHVHIVVKGDTLWHIAERYVHNPWRYPELASLSRIKNPDLIYPGQRVIIVLNYKAP